MDALTFAKGKELIKLKMTGPRLWDAPWRDLKYSPKWAKIKCLRLSAAIRTSKSNDKKVAGSKDMAKRRGNPNWGKPEPIGPVVPTITSFEQVVKEYKLTPDQYVRSSRLREWARRNKNSKYIPEALLEAWGFEIESSL